MDDIAELLHDPDFETSFTVKIASGHRDDSGEWVETVTDEQRLGVIQPASKSDTQYLTEGDKTQTAIKVWSTEYFSTSDSRVPKLGDIITWHTSVYRIVNVKDWSQYGYWQALAVETKDDDFDSFGFKNNDHAKPLAETDDKSIGGYWVRADNE